MRLGHAVALRFPVLEALREFRDWDSTMLRSIKVYKRSGYIIQRSLRSTSISSLARAARRFWTCCASGLHIESRCR